MPKMVLLAAVVSIAGNDLSEYCSKVELAVEVEEKDVTVYTSLGWKESIGGLASGNLGLGLKQDVATTKIDSIMWPLFLTRTPQTFAVRSDDGAVTSSNPQWSGSVLIKEWKPIMGSVGDVAEVDVSYPTSGEVVRATAT